MRILDYQGKHWEIIDIIKDHLIDDSKWIKESYGADLVLKKGNNYYVLDELIDAEFEDIGE